MENDFAIKNIPDNWELITLGELLDKEGGAVQTGPFGSQLHASDYVEKGIPSVMPKNITIEGINQDDIARITYEDAHRLKKYLLAKGDIVYSRRGDVEKCALVKNNESGWLCGTGCLRVRLGANSKLTPEYLHAYLSAPAIREWISRNAVGATMPNLNTGILKNVPLIVPTKKATQFIADAWLTINSKITLNQKTNQTLEQMAQALFKSWFVDFDPVFDNLLASVDFKLESLENRLPDNLKLKAQRRLAVLNSLENAAECKASLIALAHELQAQLPTKEATQAAVQVSEKAAETSVKANLNANPNILAQHANTHAHFPCEFEHNEQLGWIPKGWTASNVGAEFDVVMGQSPPGSSYNEEKKGIPFFQGKTDYGFRFPTNRVYCTSPKRLARKNDTLVSVRAPVGTINLAAEDCAIGRGLAAVRHKSGSISFTYYAMNDLAKHFAVFEGEGTVFGSINQKDFNAITQLSYPLELILYFSSICSNWDNKIEQVSHQTIVLTKIRDTLLPKLISGEVQIPDVTTDEKIVD